MLVAIVLAASGLAIPFGSPSPPRAETPRALERIETAFEFAEQAEGYQLNALVFDLAAGRRLSVPVASCAHIDIDSFTETDFGTPVICDGVRYTFDLRDGALVVDGSGGGKTVEVRSFARGRVVLNGMPLLIE